MQHIQQFPHIRLFLYSWSKENTNEGSRIPISVPPTLIFEHGVPKAVLLPEEEISEFIGGATAGSSSFEAEFAAAQNRYLQDRNTDEISEPHIVTARRSPKDVSHPMLMAAMSNPVMAPGVGDPEAVVAYFVGLSDGPNGENRVDVRYMNREQLKRFFSKRELPDREGTKNELEEEHAGATKQSKILADYRHREKTETDAAVAEHHKHFDDMNNNSSRGGGGQEEEDDNKNKSKNKNSNKPSGRVSSPVRFVGVAPSPSSGGNSPGCATPNYGSTSPHRGNSPQQDHLTSLSPPRGNAAAAGSGRQPRSRSPPRSPPQDATTSKSMQLTGILQRFEYTPSHHSEIVTMRWTRSYCDFERVRNSVLLEDRSRRAAERAATVDAPPTLVRRYSVTERLKTLMRCQADLLADRFNAALHQAGRSFALTQATFLFRMGFHGHVYFLWCSKMQLEKNFQTPSAQLTDWMSLVRRPQLKSGQQDGEDANSKQLLSAAASFNSLNNTAGESSQHSGGGDVVPADGSYGSDSSTAIRYHAYGRRFIDIDQTMLDREQMLRGRGLSRELGDLDEPLRKLDDDSDDDGDGSGGGGGGGGSSSTSCAREASLRRTRSRFGSFRNGPPGSSSGGSVVGSPSALGAAGAALANKPLYKIGTGLMPLYSEHRIAVTQAQRHLGRSLPLSTTLITNVSRRGDGGQTKNLLSASRSLRANRDNMLDILKDADFALHGRFERPKLRHAGTLKKGESPISSSRRGGGSSKHNKKGGGGGGGSPTTSSFIKEDLKAGTIEAKLIRLLGPKGRQAAQMLPQLIEELEKERKERERQERELALQEEAEELADAKRIGSQINFIFDDDDDDDRDDHQEGNNNNKSKHGADSSFLSSQHHHNHKHHQTPSSGMLLQGSPSSSLRRNTSNAKSGDDDGSTTATGSIPRPNAVLLRSVMSSWKSWVSVYFARIRLHFPKQRSQLKAAWSSPQLSPSGSPLSPTLSPLHSPPPPHASSSSAAAAGAGAGAGAGASGGDGTTQHSSSFSAASTRSIDGKSAQNTTTRNNASAAQQQQQQQSVLTFGSATTHSMMDQRTSTTQDGIAPLVLPIASSVPLELLELHHRNLRLVPQHRTSSLSSSSPQPRRLSASSGSSSPASASSLRSNDNNDNVNNDNNNNSDLGTLAAQSSCVAFWTGRFESVGAVACSAQEARDTDKACGKHNQIDDSALHNCRAIDAADVFCFITPSQEVAEEVCKMIQQVCVYSAS